MKCAIKKTYICNVLGGKRFSRPEMEALQFDPHRKTLSIIKADLPAIIEKHEVIVKVVYAGVCGTDLHIMKVSCLINVLFQA